MTSLGTTSLVDVPRATTEQVEDRTTDAATTPVGKATPDLSRTSPLTRITTTSKLRGRLREVVVAAATTQGERTSSHQKEAT